MNPITLERAGLPYGVADAGDIPALGRPVARDVESLRVERLAAPAAASASGTGVALTPPSAASQQRLEVANRAEIASLVQAQAVGEDAGLARQVVLAGASTLLSAGLMSPQAFEIELAKITGEVENQQKKLKLTEIEQARKQNLQKMEDNQQKIRESEEAAKEAQKSGLAAKIFGWISAIASIIVGAIMVATGVGAAAGALMIAGGVMGVVSQSVQQAAADGLISKEVMEKLGPALMGIEIAVALLAAVVSFGGSAVGGLAKLGAKIGGKAAEMTASLASKVADLGGKFGSLAGQSLSHSLKLGVQVSDLTLDVANGAAQATHSGFQAKAANRQADVQESRADLTTLQGVIERLKEELSRMLEAFQEIMERIFAMLQAKGETLHNLSSRPAAI
ncbi:TPA: type III secretion system translocon subunit PopB [Pseudomonas aeruginosa]